jgi:hypothetical protein
MIMRARRGMNAMKMMPRVTGMLVLGTAILCMIGLSAAPSGAAVLLEEHFDSFDTAGPGVLVDTPGGKGWRSGVVGDDRERGVYLKYPAAEHLRAGQGAIEMEMIRRDLYDWEEIFSLVDASGKGLFNASMGWEGWFQEKFPELNMSSREPTWYLVKTVKMADGQKKGSRIPYAPLGNIGKGQRVHLVFSWGPKSGDNAVYFNGRKLPLKVAKPFGMPVIVGKAAWLTFGATPVSDMVGGISHLNSPLEYVRVYDEPMSGTTLYNDPERYESKIAPPAVVASIDHDAARVAGFSGKLVAGDVMTVTMEGTAGQEAAFDVARITDIRGELPVSWKGWGVHLDPDKRFFDEGEINLEDVDGYRIYVTSEPIGGITAETAFVEELETEEQSYLVEDLEPDTPYYITVAALMDDGTFLPVLSPKQGIPMAEVEGNPGLYEGALAVDYKDLYPEAVIVGHLGSGDGAAALVSDELFEIDARLNIEVATEPSELKADEKSESEVTVTVTDANGETVSGHEVRFVLATTSQYTGVVGGGRFADEVGGALELDFRSETDLFGRVTATYTAGFAAKTAIIAARDMASDDVGAGYVKTYINAAAELELEAVQEVAGKALGYSITVTSSDEWLTADGESEARITALVTKDGIPVEGHRVGFSVTSGSGKVRTVKGETGGDGKARAVYTAGKKIGMVLVTAKDHTVGIVGSVQIELRSDAPAKIAVTVTPDLLPADGNSRADVMVVVTDINDNPNEGVEVEYAVAIGSGRIRNVDEVTDRDGESTAEYVAGRTPGKVTIEVTVRSTVPTEEEMAEARDLAVAVPDYDFF